MDPEFGDPDIYAAFREVEPSTVNPQFRSTKVGADELVIHPLDPKNLGGMLYIAVKAHVHPSVYKISVHVNKFCDEKLVCSGHGQCNQNKNCECYESWDGLLCDMFSCSENCNGKGNCEIIGDEPSCNCQGGYEGKACEIEINTGVPDVEFTSFPSTKVLNGIPSGRVAYGIVSLKSAEIQGKILTITAERDEKNDVPMQLWIQHLTKPTPTNIYLIGKQIGQSVYQVNTAAKSSKLMG